MKVAPPGTIGYGKSIQSRRIPAQPPAKPPKTRSQRSQKDPRNGPQIIPTFLHKKLEIQISPQKQTSFRNQISAQFLKFIYKIGTPIGAQKMTQQNPAQPPLHNLLGNTLSIPHNNIPRYAWRRSSELVLSWPLLWEVPFNCVLKSVLDNLG